MFAQLCDSIIINYSPLLSLCFHVFNSLVQAERLRKKVQPPKRICVRKSKTCSLCGKILKAGNHSLNRHLKQVHSDQSLSISTFSKKQNEKKQSNEHSEASFKWKTNMFEKYLNEIKWNFEWNMQKYERNQCSSFCIATPSNTGQFTNCKMNSLIEFIRI